MRNPVSYLICLPAIVCAVIFARADERTDAYYEAIANAIAAGNFLTADSILHEWKNAGNEPIERTFAEGHVAYRRGQAELGKQLTDSAINLSPKSLDFRTRQIREQYLAGQRDEAFQGIRKLAAETAKNQTNWLIDDAPIDIPADEAVCLLMSSHIYNQLNHFLPSTDLRQFADSVIKAYPEYGSVLINTGIGYALYEKGDKAGAIQAWEQALPGAHQPELSHLRALLATSYGEVGDTQRSSDLAKLILDDPESDPEICQYIKQSYSVEVDTLSYRQIQFNVLSYFASPLATEWITENLEHPEIILPKYLAGMNYVSERDLSCIKAERFDVEANFADSTALLPVIVWTMPEPKNFVDCKYVAFVPQGDSLRYITLEKTLPLDNDEFKNMYIVCEAVFNVESEGYDHRNYGYRVGDNLTTEQFSRLAAHAVYDMSSRAGVERKGNKTTIHIPGAEEK